MAFTRPTLAELVARIEADLVSRLRLAGAVLRVSVVRVLARVLAGAAHMLHGHLEFLGRQLFPDLSEGPYLLRQASLFRLSLTAATYATATVAVTGTTGTTVPKDTVLRREDGAEYTVDADVVLSGGAGTLAVTAALAGLAYSVAVSTVLTFESPVSGVDSVGTVMSQVDGTDRESVDSLRDRLKARLADPPMGGSDADYVAWAREVAGVTRAWVYPRELGPGTVLVRFVRDTDADLIPSSGEVAVMQAHLDEVAPSHATVTAAAPIDAPMAVTVHVTPDTTAVRNAVTAELEDLLLREAVPGGTVLLSAIRTAIGTAPGLTDYVLMVPSADVTRTTGQITTLGTVTWA